MDEVKMQDTKEFTNEERRRVRDVLTRIMDEMDDSGSLNDMYLPYAEVVRIAMTDPTITQALAESQHVWTPEELMMVWTRTNPD